MTEYSKTDFADHTDENIRSAFFNSINSPAEAAIVPEGPIPLFRPLGEPMPFPMAALGQTLSKAAAAIEAVIQCAPECAANSVLAGASLAAQGRADVLLPIGEGKPVPLSLFFMTVLESGERKSSADSYGLKPVREFERELAEAETQDRSSYDIQMRARATVAKELEKKNKSNLSALEAALKALGPAPLPPVISTIAPSGDSTFEGLFRIYEHGRPDIGIFSDDGATFLGGHSLKAEQKQATTANLCRLWDGAKVERVRGGDGVNILYGRRLACHLMVQPGVASGFVNDREFADQGLLPRFLISMPDGRAGTRFRDDHAYRAEVAKASRDIEPYYTSIHTLLHLPVRWVNEADRTLGVERDRLRFNPDARAAYVAYYNEIEGQMALHGPLSGIKGFASKVIEQAARIAGVITLVENPEATCITAGTLADAIILARYYCSEAVRLTQSGSISPHLKDADDLRRWLQTQTGDLMSLRQIYQYGPKAIRNSKVARAAMGILADHYWVVAIDGGATVEGMHSREVWKIVREVPSC